jgi:CBS domain-containing protein
MTLEAASGNDLSLVEAPTVAPEKPVAEVIVSLDERPVIVVSDERPEEILGILTAFDLL